MRNAKVRVGGLAGRQVGRVSRAQLLALGVESAVVTRWIDAGYLYPELPGVYAVGHPARSEESDLFAAVLYAGPGAALWGLSAAVWRGLVKWRTAPTIEVATCRRRNPLAAGAAANHLGRPIVLRRAAEVVRSEYHGVPTVPIPQIALAIAATGELELLRFMLAQLDFMRILDVTALERGLGRGVRGSRVLRQAIDRPLPVLARARSPFEVKLVLVCEEAGIPLPELNQKVAGITVDALWRDQMVIVECDGEGNHGTWRQRRRDAANEMTLRRLGFLVIRYTTEQLDDPAAVRADLMPQLDERRGRGELAA